MRNLILAAVSIAGVLASATAFAVDGDQSVEAIAVSDPGRMVCQYFYHDGTLVKRPVCQTAQYWVNENTRTRRELLEFQLRRLSSPH
jgi:hypothetical protein